MIKPFKGSFPLTQGFGENPASYAQFGLKGHDGLDYGLPTGTEVTAPHLGKIIETGVDPTGYGNYIKIENDKEGSVLAHLKDFNVIVGQVVTEGQLLGHSDNTGNSTGPHLHWGYYLFPRDRTNGYAGFINQYTLIGQGGVVMDYNPQKAGLFDTIEIAFPDRLGVNGDSNKATLDQTRAFIAWINSNTGRAGKWDTLCIKAGITGDSNKVTVDQLFASIESLVPPVNPQVLKNKVIAAVEEAFK